MTSKKSVLAVFSALFATFMQFYTQYRRNRNEIKGEIDMFDLKNRVIVVSGASSGLGSQMARGFAAQGATLVITARRLEKLEKLAEEIRAMGVECMPIKCDVTDPEQVNAAAAAVEKAFGKVDVLVNCAGSAKNAGVLEMTNEEWDFTMSADLDSVFYVTGVILPIDGGYTAI